MHADKPTNDVKAAGQKDCHDVTAGALSMQEGEFPYRLLVETMDEGLGVTDADHRFTYVNRRFAAILGHEQGEVVGHHLLEFIPDEDKEAMRRRIDDRKSGRAERYEMAWLRKDGTKVHTIIAPKGLFDREGDFVGSFGVITDISDRKRAEQALGESEQRYRMLLDNIQLGIVMVDKDYNIVMANEAQGRLFRKSPAEMIGKKCYEQFEKREKACSCCPGVLGMATGKAAETVTTAVRDDGSIFPVHIRSFPLTDSQGETEGFIEVVEDITERKRAEEERRNLENQIQHTQKLESLGVLAGGIAHDFNNLLVAILGNADLALMDLMKSSPTRPRLEEIRKAAIRASDLTNQMLAYSGKGRFVVEPLNLNMVVEEMTHLLEVSISKKVQLRFNFAGRLPPIEADAAQIRQIVMNLIINASEAVGDQPGLIIIRTGVMEADEEFLQHATISEGFAEGHYVYLEVADTGCGMDSETRKKLFDPFFTTKFAGRGLGLAAVLGIVRGHKGAIKVESTPGRGTTFTILLPYTAEAVEPHSTTVDEETPGPWRASGTILVADDEQSVRDVARMAMERCGLTVLLAGDGAEAVDVFREHADEIRAVVLDLTMPKLDGVQAAMRIREIRPETKVILSSGYSEQDAVNRFGGERLSGFIQKPFEVSRFLGLVRRILGE